MIHAHETLDINVVDHGSLVSLMCLTDQALRWVEANCDAPDYMWTGGRTLNVEHRYADDIINGAQADGLNVA